MMTSTTSATSTTSTASDAFSSDAHQTVDAIKGYHAHVYFDADQHDEAIALRDAAGALIPEARLGRVHQGPIAFHTAPMFQIAIPPERFAELVPWLMLNRGNLRILIHPLTGDPWQEHIDQALWLGEPVPIDREKLRRISA